MLHSNKRAARGGEQRVRAFHWRARPSQISNGRALKKHHPCSKGQRARGVCARARGRISWKHRPSVSTPARSRARPVVQSVRRWEMEVYVEPAVACAECGSGVRLLNNGTEFISTFRVSLWRASPALMEQLDVWPQQVLEWEIKRTCSQKSDTSFH